MREKPVRSPMVPPIADSWSTNLAARSYRVIRLIILYWYLTHLSDPVEGWGGERNLDKLHPICKLKILKPEIGIYFWHTKQHLSFYWEKWDLSSQGFCTSRNEKGRWRDPPRSWLWRVSGPPRCSRHIAPGTLLQERRHCWCSPTPLRNKSCSVKNQCSRSRWKLLEKTDR